MARAFYGSQIGSVRNVLFEREEHDDLIYGFTENYVRVEVPYDPLLVNELVEVKLEEFSPNGNLKAQEVILQMV